MLDVWCVTQVAVSVVVVTSGTYANHNDDYSGHLKKFLIDWLTCTYLPSDRHHQHTNTTFHRPDALPAAQWTVSKHRRQKLCFYHRQIHCRSWSQNVTEEHKKIINRTNHITCAPRATSSCSYATWRLCSAAVVWGSFPTSSGINTSLSYNQTYLTERPFDLDTTEGLRERTESVPHLWNWDNHS